MRSRPKRKSITIQDVAREAGFSVSTVSRVLNNKDDVSLDTYEKVQRVIEEMRYASSLAARGMRSHRTNVIGLVLSDVVAPYCTGIIRGVSKVVSQSDYDLLIYTSGDYKPNQAANKESKLVMLLNGGIADGVIVVTPAAATSNFPSHAPLVIIDPNTESSDFPGVIATNREGALSAMNYLTGLGHCRIGYIAGRLELISAVQRLQGYKDGLAAAGIPFDEELVQIGDYQNEAAMECTRKLLSSPNPPTAIFAANDMSAMGVYQAAKDRGLRIPDDLSVVGFDNLFESAFLEPPLTTVDQFITQMGTIAAETMISQLKGDAVSVKVHIVPTQLVVRDSCCPLK
jgi:LacI family transcriptional regulator